jgi:hypothetical protein
MITEKDAVIGRRVVWRSRDDAGGEIRSYGTIVEVNDAEVIIDYDDGHKGLSYVGNTLSSVSPV